jgi:hypothetical protein
MKMATCVNLLPGPDIPDDGDCVLAATISQVKSFFSCSLKEQFINGYPNKESYIFLSR